METQPLDTLLDRLLASTAGASAVLAGLCLFVLLLRGSPNPGRLRAAIDPVGATMPVGTRGLLIAGRAGFAALAIRCVLTSLARLGWVQWWTFASDVVLLACDFGIIFAALFAIRQTTYEVCGNRALWIFSSAAVVVGGGLYLWG